MIKFLYFEFSFFDVIILPGIFSCLGWDVESDVDMNDLEDDCGKDNDTEKGNGEYL